MAKMTTGLVKEQNLEKQIEKQMGCMAGFLQLFDRHQFLNGKRLYSPKRLPPSPFDDTTSESEKSAPDSPAVSRELGKPAKQVYSVAATPSPERPNQSAMEVAELPPKSPLPLPIFELKQGIKSSWKFCKETPRLSLDSRATTDAKGGLHPKEIRTSASILSPGNRCDSNASDATDGSQHNRSPSVIARLMGLEPLPNLPTSEPEKKPQLRRSASESRVSRDLFQSRFATEGSGFYSKQPNQPNLSNATADNMALYADPRNYSVKNACKVEPPPKVLSYNSLAPWRAPQHRKSFFDSADIFPEPKQTVSIYGEIEKRLKMRGIEEPSKDLETLKQILEALQLKGLLHSRRPSEQDHRNFVYDESPIVVMRPSRMSTPSINRRTGNACSPPIGGNQTRGVRRNYGDNSQPVSPRRDRNARSPVRAGRSTSPTTRNEGNAGARRSNSLVKPKPLSIETQRRLNESTEKPKPLSIETQRRLNESTENRRVSPIQSPKPSPRRTGPDPTVNNRSQRSKKATAEIYQKEKIATVVSAEDESSSISGSSFTTSTDTERSKSEYKEGRTLLERCDQLLNSIAEMNTTTDMQQPSPVSVLDSSFYKDDSFTPSPVTTKRNIDFKDQSVEWEDELWSPVIWPSQSKSDDCDFAYISDIMRASRYLPEDSDVFSLLEKQQYLKGKDTSKVSRLQRKLIFDTINEILDRSRRLPPWKQANENDLKFDKVWSEFLKIRERDSAEDLFEIICGVLKKDLAGDDVYGWGDCPMEVSEAVLDIERLIFKDLISETIRDLVADATSSSVMPRRKLVF